MSVVRADHVENRIDAATREETRPDGSRAGYAGDTGADNKRGPA
jgi:hypothetical protein